MTLKERILKKAIAYYWHAEAPDEEDMVRLFELIRDRDEAGLDELLAELDVDWEDEE